MNMKEMNWKGKLFDGIVFLYSIIQVERKLYRKILPYFYDALNREELLLILDRLVQLRWCGEQLSQEGCENEVELLRQRRKSKDDPGIRI
jgi:hypothetical protein